MKYRSCRQEYSSRKPYHRYCDACWADLQAQRRRHGPRHPRLNWLEGDRIIWWFLLVALPALIIYALGRLLGLW
jgi:hypothetical protein